MKDVNWFLILFCNSILQIKKINLIRAKIFPVSESTSMDVTGNDLLLVRTEEEAKCWIRNINRLTRDLINEFPSVCDHICNHLNKYAQHQDNVFESCSTCQEIYAHNINTGKSFSVHKGSKIIRMCDGPAGSLLVLKQGGELHRLDWDKTQHRAKLVFVQNIPYMSGKSRLRLCYVECHDICMYTLKDKEEDKGYEVIAVRLGSETIVWRLSSLVDGCVIKPECMTCDPEGNAYVSDRGNNRILQINSSTGVTLSIIVLKEKAMIWSMHWSNMEPNLTLKTKNGIITYFVPK